MPKSTPVKTAPPPTARVAKPEAPKAKTPEPGRGRPQRFTYALKCYTAERHADGWWIGKTPLTSAGEKPDWSGPFQDIENACLAIARRLATEIADRHTRMIETHKIALADPLYGLKPTTRLKPAGNGSSTT